MLMLSYDKYRLRSLRSPTRTLKVVLIWEKSTLTDFLIRPCITCLVASGRLYDHEMDTDKKWLIAVGKNMIQSIIQLQLSYYVLSIHLWIFLFELSIRVMQGRILIHVHIIVKQKSKAKQRDRTTFIHPNASKTPICYDHMPKRGKRKERKNERMKDAEHHIIRVKMKTRQGKTKKRKTKRVPGISKKKLHVVYHSLGLWIMPLLQHLTLYTSQILSQFFCLLPIVCHLSNTHSCHNGSNCTSEFSSWTSKILIGIVVRFNTHLRNHSYVGIVTVEFVSLTIQRRKARVAVIKMNIEQEWLIHTKQP